jgi:hypothetical protein
MRNTGTMSLRLVAALLATGCSSSTYSGPNDKEGARFDVPVTIETQVGSRQGAWQAPIVEKQMLTIQIRNGRGVFVPNSVNGSGPLTANGDGTYPVPRPLLDSLLPNAFYPAAGFSQPSEPGWNNVTLSDVRDGHTGTWTDQFGSVGQPLSASLVVDGVQELGETFTYTTGSNGASLYSAIYLVYSVPKDMYVRATVRFDSVTMRFLADRALRNQPTNHVRRTLASLRRGLRAFSPFRVECLYAETSALAMDACHDAWGTLWGARLNLAAATFAVCEAPFLNSARLYFLSAVATAGLARRGVCTACGRCPF